MTMTQAAAIEPPARRSPNDARTDRKKRAKARIQAAVDLQPDLRVDRISPIRRVLTCYRAGLFDPFSAHSPLADYIEVVEREVVELEARARTQPRRAQLDGATIRRALCFLKTFGRVSALDFDSIPIEERDRVVRLLQLEYRFCFAAAGTTPRAFKIAIGRTGAR